MTVNSSVDDVGMSEFYSSMADFYKTAPRHISPTKRLIKLKDSTWTHKSVF